MLNKKAIAALAAGATLVSGLAFAAPAFADEPAKKPTAEECKNAQDNVNAKKSDLEQKKATLVLKNAAKKTAHDDLAKAKAAVEAYKTAVKNFNKAKFDVTQADQNDGVAVATAKKAADEAAAAVKTAIEAAQKTSAKLDAAPAAPANGEGAAPALNAYDAKLDTIKTDAADSAASDAQDEVTVAEGAVEKAEAHLRNLGCEAKSEDPTPTPDPKPTPKPTPLPDVPNVPLFGLSDAQVRALTRLENTYVVLKKDQSAFEFLHDLYVKSEAAYKSALAKYQAADNEYLAAQQKANDLKAAGKEDTDAYKAARNEEQAAGARKTAAQANYDDAAADFLAKTKAVNAAADKFNADLVLYRNAYNNAVAVRADVSGFPKPNDVAKAPTFGVPNQVKEAAKKAEAKKADAKKSAAPLAKTGAAVALAAVAASVLAGIGAALRKIRH